MARRRFPAGEPASLMETHPRRVGVPPPTAGGDLMPDGLRREQIMAKSPTDLT
ncbi:hypothetical protein EV384_4781 [Micromonospora kangleipakensis]|uniref:Uncharacterized protein n=1 Tax=Micromonospora kangleipakensis TaxID=1077942 RepID=A0A4Q8BFJ0_9ACTN|nr:hypothetical protein EV384_4781 [Micromonospora kangleipakensis]